LFLAKKQGKMPQSEFDNAKKVRILSHIPPNPAKVY
ncbi:unnamed protein product, partial [marine sediment metagenome]